MSRRHPEVDRMPAGPVPKLAFCAWLDGDEMCDTFGPVIKGLCQRHYDVMKSRVHFEGLLLGRPGVLPTTCTCSDPRPRQCRIIGGVLPIADAYECRTCGRAIL